MKKVEQIEQIIKKEERRYAIQGYRLVYGLKDDKVVLDTIEVVQGSEKLQGQRIVIELHPFVDEISDTFWNMLSALYAQIDMTVDFVIKDGFNVEIVKDIVFLSTELRGRIADYESNGRNLFGELVVPVATVYTELQTDYEWFVGSLNKLCVVCLKEKDKELLELPYAFFERQNMENRTVKTREGFGEVLQQAVAECKFTEKVSIYRSVHYQLEREVVFSTLDNGGVESIRLRSNLKSIAQNYCKNEIFKNQSGNLDTVPLSLEMAEEASKLDKKHKRVSKIFASIRKVYVEARVANREEYDSLRKTLLGSFVDYQRYANAHRTEGVLDFLMKSVYGIRNLTRLTNVQVGAVDDLPRGFEASGTKVGKIFGEELLKHIGADDFEYINAINYLKIVTMMLRNDLSAKEDKEQFVSYFTGDLSQKHNYFRENEGWKKLVKWLRYWLLETDEEMDLQFLDEYFKSYNNYGIVNKKKPDVEGFIDFLMLRKDIYGFYNKKSKPLKARGKQYTREDLLTHFVLEKDRGMLLGVAEQYASLHSGKHSLSLRVKDIGLLFQVLEKNLQLFCGLSEQRKAFEWVDELIEGVLMKDGVESIDNKDNYRTVERLLEYINGQLPVGKLKSIPENFIESAGAELEYLLEGTTIRVEDNCLTLSGHSALDWCLDLGLRIMSGDMGKMDEDTLHEKYAVQIRKYNR